MINNLPIALAIRQPEAFLIVNGIKTVENRTWMAPARIIGQTIFIHASKRPRFDFTTAVREVARRGQSSALASLANAGKGTDLGGIVGMATVVACVRDSLSPWAEPGAWHWILANACPLPFMPCRGQLGLFHVTYENQKVAGAA
ncbi:ASCH domain-containing protein [Solidesulfovibrio sp.]